MRVEVYRNLHNCCWSVRERGLVVKHATNLQLMDCALVVQPAGNRRVRQQGRKNVHAFVRGNIERMDFKLGREDGEEIYYNPHQFATFVIKRTGEPIFRAARVLLLANGKAYLKREAWYG